MQRSLYYIVLVVALFLSAVLLWVLWTGEDQSYPQQESKPVIALEHEELLAARTHLLRNDSKLRDAVQRGSGFGGERSVHVAYDIFGSSKAAVEDVRDKTQVVKIDEGAWLIRFPIVNAVLVETRVGLVLIDSGYEAASEVLLETVRKLSDKPLHTVIYTHGHVDHAYGLRALMNSGERPEIVAHENLPRRFHRYIKMRGSLAKYMGQPPSSLPKQVEDFVFPTRVFDERLELLIGGESFVIVHHRAETDDQVYVWMPDRRILASADYYQGFLPNAGNGKRIQRFPEEWVIALREMAMLEPAHLAPGHGEAIVNDGNKIKRELTLLADALQSIIDQTLDGLNQALRKDLVVARVELPPVLRKQRALREQYVSVQDIAKMVVRQHTGWWDDVPSHWTPAPLGRQATEIAQLAGGVEVLAQRATALIRKDIRLASHLVDWAWFADPGHPAVQEAVLAVYRARILHKQTNTMERVNYLKVMSEAKAYQLQD